jgi:hypothetical protein
MTTENVATTRPAAPSDAELVDVLRDAFPGREIATIERWPFVRASSYSLEEINLSFEDGGMVDLVFKDLAWERLLDGAAQCKPWFLYSPRRDIETHRGILGPEGLGPHCYAAVSDLDRGRYWLLLERVRGPRLEKIADFAVWQAVATWLGRFHGRFAARLEEVRVANPFLLEYDIDLYLMWHARACAALDRSDDPRARKVRRLLAGYERVAEALAARRSMFLHGEFYPSNVLVDFTYGDLRVCPVDWEVSAIGPGMLDLAAMSGGKWNVDQRTRFLTAYRDGLLELGIHPAPWEEMVVTFDQCQLHLALQWLGWSTERPARGRRHDWIGEALRAARRLR